MTEVWKKIPFAERYEVSSKGRVKSLCGKKSRILKLLNPPSCKYLLVNIYVEKNQKTFGVHRLILLTFKGEPPGPNYQCAHIDGDPQNNTLENLGWFTPKENNAHKNIHGTNPKGEAHANNKYKAKDIRKAKEMLKQKMPQSLISLLTGVPVHVVKDLRRGGWPHIEV